MYELSVALKYLVPRWRQLSVSIISFISILVIALVVWLIVVFFSVVNGLEKNWVDKLIALTAPVRITPTEEYYNSYYYLADSISEASDYSTKSLQEKLAATKTDPYNPEADEELPKGWAAPDRNSDGSLKDIVKLAFQAINETKGIAGLQASDYELTAGNLRLRLIRDTTPQKYTSNFVEPLKNQAFLSQTAYIGSFDPTNHSLANSILPYTMEDLSNVYGLLGVASDDNQEESPEFIRQSTQETVRKRLEEFFDVVTITELKTPDHGWILPKELYPKTARLRAIAISKGPRIKRLIIPQAVADWVALETSLAEEGYETHVVKLDLSNDKAIAIFEDNSRHVITMETPFIVQGALSLQATLDKGSLAKAIQPRDVLFRVKVKLQEIPLEGTIPYNTLTIAAATIKDPFVGSAAKPLWAYTHKGEDGLARVVLPTLPEIGDGILLPRSFREAGNRIGDRGFLGYFTPTASSVQEQRIPVFVAGFYDPGIIPIGGKYVLANAGITSLIRGSHNQDDAVLSNGINVRFDKTSQAEEVKKALVAAFQSKGIGNYWNIQTYREYEFTRDLIQQLGSEQNLFTLISIVIIIVACSNIISMLIILVNDKKLEIGILRSMGASSASIAAIFGTCGVIMGVTGSVIGTAAALLTLKNLNSLISLISWFQGYDMFNPLFYGDTLPSEISYEALAFVLISTAVISLLAGIVPAVKASMMKPSAILRSE